jgi:spore maturation protein CgeE
MKLDKITSHEQFYVSLFSKVRDHIFGYEAEDLKQRDKYYHNYLHLLNDRFTKQDIDYYIDKNLVHGFIMIRAENGLDIRNFIDSKDIIDQDAYYGNDIKNIHINKKRNVDVRLVNPETDESFFDSLYKESIAYGKTYAQGNKKRQKEVLSESKDAYFYLKATYNHKIVGMLNACIRGNLAKIDDFVIKEDFQKQGFGSALMFDMIELLKKRGIEYVYLVTDDEDTPKVMYEKWGFQLISTYLVIRKMYNEEK